MQRPELSKTDMKKKSLLPVVYYCCNKPLEHQFTKSNQNINLSKNHMSSGIYACRWFRYFFYFFVLDVFQISASEISVHTKPRIDAINYFVVFAVMKNYM